MIHAPKLTEKQRELAELMSQMSEQLFCAGWLIGLESLLWHAVVETDRAKVYEGDEMDAEDIDKLRQLSQEIGGWIYYRSDREVPGLPHDQWGETFVPMAEWLAMYDRESSGRRR